MKEVGKRIEQCFTTKEKTKWKMRKIKRIPTRTISFLVVVIFVMRKFGIGCGRIWVLLRMRELYQRILFISLSRRVAECTNFIINS
jgi:hypothetical protein